MVNGVESRAKINVHDIKIRVVNLCIAEDALEHL